MKVAIIHKYFLFYLGVVQLGEVQCLGDESTLLSCSHNKSVHCKNNVYADDICSGIYTQVIPAAIIAIK